jgi:hypothetical protein
VSASVVTKCFGERRNCAKPRGEPGRLPRTTRTVDFDQ